MSVLVESVGAHFVPGRVKSRVRGLRRRGGRCDPSVSYPSRPRRGTGSGTTGEGLLFICVSRRDRTFVTFSVRDGVEEVNVLKGFFWVLCSCRLLLTFDFGVNDLREIKILRLKYFS